MSLHWSIHHTYPHSAIDQLVHGVFHETECLYDATPNSKQKHGRSIDCDRWCSGNRLCKSTILETLLNHSTVRLQLYDHGRTRPRWGEKRITVIATMQHEAENIIGLLCINRCLTKKNHYMKHTCLSANSLKKECSLNHCEVTKWNMQAYHNSWLDDSYKGERDLGKKQTAPGSSLHSNQLTEKL